MSLLDMGLMAGGIGFTTYWLATFVTWESGPFHIFERMRWAERDGTWLKGFVSCPICQGPLWVVLVEALFLAIYVRAHGGGMGLADLVQIWFVAVGIHVFLARVGVPNIEMYQVQQTMELERARMREQD